MEGGRNRRCSRAVGADHDRDDGQRNSPTLLISRHDEVDPAARVCRILREDVTAVSLHTAV
jgi:hypothetical protein